MTKTISRKGFVLVLLMCLFSLSTPGQSTNLEIRQPAGRDLLDWNVYDSFEHLMLAGSPFVSDTLISIPLESDERYVFEVVVSADDAGDLQLMQDSILLILSMNGQPLIIIPGHDLAAGVYTCPFHTGIQDQQLKVVGGSQTDISLFPWQAFLIAGNNACGGTIIGNKWILTAAHCLFDRLGREVSPGSMLVIVGSTDPYDPTKGEAIPVSHAIIHKSYTTPDLDYDLALLELREEIQDDHAASISIVTAEDSSLGATDPGVLATLTGWGSTSIDPEVYPDTLQYVQLPIVSNQVASQVWGPIPPTFLMAGYEDGSKDACIGDSGGPLVVPLDGDYKLAGIVSWGSENCDTYGAYTRISQFEKWIRDNSGIQDPDVLKSLDGDQLICQGTDSSKYHTTKIPDARYEWKLAPSEAGQIDYLDEQASISWDEQYLGTALLSARVELEGERSAWKRLSLEIAVPTEVSWQSHDTVICEQEPFQLAVEATGDELVYDWYKDGKLWKANTADSIDFPSINRDDSGDYSGLVSGTCGSLATSEISVTVLPLTGILSQSPDTRAQIGTSATLEVFAEGHDLFYQWEKDGRPLPGENAPQLLLTDVNANLTGIYRVNLEGTCGSLISDSIYLYISASNNIQQPDVYIWPTLSTALFNIASNLDAYFDLAVFNMRGQLMKRMDHLRYRTIIDLSGMNPGTYLVYIRSGSWSKTMKIQKL